MKFKVIQQRRGTVRKTWIEADSPEEAVDKVRKYGWVIIGVDLVDTVTGKGDK